MTDATWRKLITDEMLHRIETWDDVVQCTLSDSELDTEFYDGYGGSSGKPFTLWTQHRVYYPVVYDGAEWCDSVARNPCDEAKTHSGGE